MLTFILCGILFIVSAIMLFIIIMDIFTILSIDDDKTAISDTIIKLFLHFIIFTAVVWMFTNINDGRFL